eukprot:5346800-Amphidinium_carterae.2
MVFIFHQVYVAEIRCILVFIFMSVIGFIPTLHYLPCFMFRVMVFILIVSHRVYVPDGRCLVFIFTISHQVYVAEAC